LQHPFRELLKYELCRNIIESKPAGGGQNLKIARYIRTKKILGFFPLHNPSVFESLYKNWIKKIRVNQALLHQIKVHFYAYSLAF